MSTRPTESIEDEPAPEHAGDGQEDVREQPVLIKR